MQSCAHPRSPSSCRNTCPLLVPTCPRPPASHLLAPPSLLHFSHAASFCHHIVGVVSLHVPLYSANKLPCGPPAPPPFCLPTFMFYPPPSSRLSFLTLSHHYVSGNTSLFCIRLFSPLWQAGQHANMQNGDREAFCNAVRKERRRNCRECICFCVFQQFLAMRAMVDTGAWATRTKGSVTKMAIGIPPLLLHGGILLSSEVFILFKGHCKRNPFFSSHLVTVNPLESESANINGKLRRNGWQLVFTSPSSSPISFSLLLICGREPMAHYNWSLSSCRWHQVSALNIINALHTSALF